VTYKRVPDALGSIYFQEFRSDGVEAGQVFALGLRDVEDVDDTEASHLLHRSLVDIFGLDFPLVLTWSKDSDALLLCG
jgi:hypothetical protein